MAIGWTVLIAFLCLVRFNDLPSFGISGLDKYVHFTFHFVFTLLWGIYFWLKLDKIEMKKTMLLVLISLLYGIIIEISQELFTTTRHADVLDVLANFTGAVTAVALFFFLKRKHEKANK